MGETKEAAPEEQPKDKNVPNSANTNIPHHSGERLEPSGTRFSETINDFFRTLYGDTAPGWVTLWVHPDKKTKWHKVNNIPAIVNDCESLMQSQNVYFGLGLRKEKLGELKRGDAKEVCAIPGVWVEIDCKGGVHKAKDLPANNEVAPFIQDVFSLMPTMVVNSGGGWHTYWLFDQLLEINNDDELQRAETILNRFQQVFIKSGLMRGWKIDNTSDIARVLRVPGTLNRKKEKPVEVRMLGKKAERRYTVDELEEAIQQSEQKIQQLQQETMAASAANQEVRKFTPKGDSPLPSASNIIKSCAFMDHCANDAASLTEPEWYKMLTVIARTDLGRDLCHDLSRPYTGYTEKETDTKIDHALEDSGPITCDKVQTDHGDEWCRSCPHKRKIKSPIVLGLDRMTEARRTVSDALKRAVDGDVGAPIETQVVGALALIEREDPADFARLKAELKKAKVPLMEVNRALKKAKRERLRIVGPGESAEPRTAGDVLTNCPYPDLIIPEQYSLTENRVYHNAIRNEGKDNQSYTQIPVALAPVLITGLYRDITTGREALRLAWKRGNKWLSTIVDRDVAANVRSIVNLAGEGFPVTSGSAGELTEYLAFLEAENLHRLPIAHVTTQLGWQGKDGSQGFLWGRTLITATGEEVNDLNMDELTPGEWRDDLISFKGVDTGDEQLSDGFHRRGTIEEWMESVKIVSNYPKALIAFYAAFVPPLLQILRCDSFVLEYAKRTSTGKSVTQRVAASVMGNPDERMADSVFHTWAISPAWLGRAGSVMTGLPLILDDTKRAKSPEFVANAIYTITSGKDSGRGTIKGLSTTRTWRTVLISSGEVKSTSFTKDGGIKGRVLSITTLPFDGDGPEVKKMVEQINKIVSLNYGHAMPLFLKWVMSQREKWEVWEKCFREEDSRYTSRVSGNVAGRLAKYAAAIDVTAALVHAAFRDMGSPLPFEYADPFDKGLWEAIATESEDATGEEEALRELVGWAHANETSFLSRHLEDSAGKARQPLHGWMGKWERGNWTYIAVYPDRLKRFLRENDYNPEEILGHWKERGWLYADKGYQKQIRFDGGKPYMICITREAIESV